MFQGGIEETACENGDANSNGESNLSDAVAMLSFILGENPDDFDVIVADFNGDSLVTVTDIIFMLMAYNLIP